MKRLKRLLAKIDWRRPSEIAEKFVKFVKQKKPAVLYVNVRIIIASTGTIISFVSFIGLIGIIKTLLKDDAYAGNELYLTAAIVSLIICVYILTVGFKSVISDLINIIRHNRTSPIKFDDYRDVEDALVQEKKTTSETKTETILERDESFVWKYLFFLGTVIIALIVKRFIPDEVFWKHGFTPGDFSFPLLLMLILTAAAALRLGAIYFHRDERRKYEVDEKIISIKGADHPSTFAPAIEKALLPLRQNGKSNIVVHTETAETEEREKDTGNIEEKLFIETPPKQVQCEPHPIGYFYLLFAAVLFITGILYLTQLPPDNISVLTVPTIALGYLWALVKGAILLFCGRAFLESANTIFRTDYFESVMVYINIEGISRRTIVKVGKTVPDSIETRKTVVRSDCHFRVYTAKLLTEIDKKEGKRQVIKAMIDKNSENAKKMVTAAIAKFKNSEQYETGPGNTNKILFLSANPRELDWLGLDKEVREIQEGLLRSKLRGDFEFQTRMAVRQRDLRRSLLENEPQIVHFSGHGERSGIIVEDDELGIAAPISKEAISGLFELCADHVECVILNACYSATQAGAINRHINYVIGMPGEINDTAAIEFSVGFYDALGAGKTVEKAFKFGCNAIKMKLADVADELIPVLIQGGTL
ncbi:MAG: CHAT domain-containing protein [bacterium]|nr:CHAT domain-containing protein [bacterium]